MNESSAVLTKHIGFRISQEVFERIQKRAANEGKPANVWCRDRVIEASERNRITPGEKTILAEILATQEILVKLLYAIVWEAKPTADRFREITSAAHTAKHELARQILEETPKDPEAKKPLRLEVYSEQAAE